jgi:hypothetical protein
MANKGTSSKRENKPGEPTNSALSSDVAINAVVQIILAALKDSPWWLKGPLVIAGILAIVAIAGSIALIASKQYGYGTSILIVAILAMLLVLAGILSVVKHAVPRAQQDALVGPKQPFIKIKWSRPMLSIPINNDDLRDLFSFVKTIHGDVFQFLSENGVSLKSNQVRVNVFIADHTDGGEGEVCKLVMIPDLCFGMAGASDADLKFSVGQGVTGEVYRDGREQIIARVKDSVDKNEDFNDFYELAPEQKKKVNPNLKWIISTPLNVTILGSTRVIGVLNVDGLFDQDIDVPTLTLVAARILKVAVDLAQRLGRFSMVSGVTGTMEVERG